MRVTYLVFINQEISLSLQKYEIRKQARKHRLCEFEQKKVSHSYSCPAGVQAEVEQGPGTVRHHGNTAGVQKGGSVGLGRRDGVCGVDDCHHPPFW